MEAFRELRREPSINTRGGVLRSSFTRRRLSSGELIEVTFRLLSDRAEEPGLSALICWAKNAAGYDVQGVTVPVFLERRAMSRRTFDNRRHRAAGIVAEGIRAFVRLSGDEGRDEAA